jgi:hypothetical protein
MPIAKTFALIRCSPNSLGDRLDRDKNKNREREERDVILETVDRIRAYFRRYPDAADTIDGVKCWLRNDQPRLRDDIVLTALDVLVAGGEIAKEKLPGDKVLYRLQPPPRNR